MTSPVAPPTMTGAPTAPDRSDRPTFSGRATAWADFQKDTLVPEVQAAINNAFTNATSAHESAQAALTKADAADASAIAAASSAAAAASSAGAAMWASGTYAAGAAARSPSTLRVYINRSTGSRTTDPALDSVNWAFPAGYLTVVPRAGTAHTVTANERSNFTNAGAVAVTLPTVLAAGDEWAGNFDNGRTDNTFDVAANQIKHKGVIRSGVITTNIPGPIHLIWGGDFWRFK